MALLQRGCGLHRTQATLGKEHFPLWEYKSEKSNRGAIQPPAEPHTPEWISWRSPEEDSGGIIPT